MLRKLLELGATNDLISRVQLSKRATIPTGNHRRLSAVMPLLAPLLGNSPCTLALLKRLPRRRYTRYEAAAPDFIADRADAVTRTAISPLVDR